jgi:acetoacetate decarboxylase
MVLNPTVLEQVVRAPFKVVEPIVKYELIRMPDSTSTSFGHHIWRQGHGWFVEAHRG